jgi:hypothetical protein
MPIATYHRGMPRRRLSRTIAALAVAALAFASCAHGTQDSTKAVTDYHGEPSGVGIPAGNTEKAPFSLWLKGGDQFTVTLDGSSTCPPVATQFEVTGQNRINLTVPNPNDQGKICTMDLVPHTTVFSTPKAIDRNAAVSITGPSGSWVLNALPPS